MALYQCNWRWYSSTAERPPQERDQLFAKVFRAAEEAKPIGQNLRAWYMYPGQTAGILIIDAATSEELAQFLRPYTEIMSFDVQPVAQADYAQARQRILGR